MVEHKNLSLHISKEQLHSIVNDMTQLHYLIFWGFDRGKMILHIYHASANNQLVFIRHRQSMELVYVKIIDDDVLSVLDRSIQFARRAEESSKQAVLKDKEVQYKEIDYYLSALYEYVENGDIQKVEETKAILKELRNDVS
jgi:hypothetical protein